MRPLALGDDESMIVNRNNVDNWGMKMGAQQSCLTLLPEGQPSVLTLVQGLSLMLA